MLFVLTAAGQVDASKHFDLTRSTCIARFVSIGPAVIGKATTAIRRELRDWTLARRSDKTLDGPAGTCNAVIRGWVNYYGTYYKSALYATLRHIDRKVVR